MNPPTHREWCLTADRRVPSANARTVVLLLAVAFLMVSPGLSVLSGAAPAAAPRAAAGTHSAGTSSRPSPPPTPGIPSSGRGAFYQNAILPLAPSANSGCYAALSVCVNGTTDPTLNFTSTGLLAAAYTSYSNVSNCGFTFSEIAVVTSSDLGGSWSAPTYLNNPLCLSTIDNDSDYENARERDARPRVRPVQHDQLDRAGPRVGRRHLQHHQLVVQRAVRPLGRDREL
jgi:hypothetical protein